jgi:rhamnose transport system permease protein
VTRPAPLHARPGLSRYRREVSVAGAIALLGVLLAIAAPGYFSRENLSDLFLANLPVLIVSLGATLIVLTGEIDISVGSVFAICGVLSGVAAKAGLPMPAVALSVLLAGAALGAANGALVAYLRLPSIVVTLATMVILREGLRWTTQGAWVQDLPAGYQWLGLSQAAYPLAALFVAAGLLAVMVWSGAHVAAGRAIYATGSNPDAARLAGFDTAFVKWGVFTGAGALTGLAALLNSVRFNQIPSNAGVGLEMKVIAAVIVGGTAIRGGRGTFAGTLLGVILLGAIGPALTFLGVNAYWERAIQGGIILAAVAVDAWRQRPPTHARAVAAGAGA